MTYVRQIDSALTELKKVTDETADTYEEFLKDASSTGREIGSTISNITTATADFARLGHSLEDASTLAKAAVVYKNVGDGINDISTASESIISVMQAFGVEARDAMSIVDKFNEIGNTQPISSTGVGEALLRSASALKEGGNTLDEAMGLVVAANATVQDPNRVGTALKTLTLRLRGMKTELNDASLDAEGMAETTSVLQEKLYALSHGKVNIMIDDENIKSTTQIIREFASAYDEMTDSERAAALELMGGKVQANVLASLIQNWDLAEESIKSAANSAGSAMRENEKYLDSIQGRIDVFNNSLESMWHNLISSDFVKGIVNVGTSVIDFIDDLAKDHGGLSVIATVLGSGGLLKGITSIVSALVKYTKIAKNADDVVKVFSGSQKALDYWTKNGTLNTLAYAAATGQLTKENIKAAASTSLLGKAVKALGSFVSGNPVAAVAIGAIVIAIGAAITVLSKYTITHKEYVKQLEESSEKLKETRGKIENVNSELETTKNRI